MVGRRAARAADRGGGKPVEALGSVGDVSRREAPQAVVPAGAWQAARPLGAWALVGCIVAPAFTFDGFEIAPEGWKPG